MAVAKNDFLVPHEPPVRGAGCPCPRAPRCAPRLSRCSVTFRSAGSSLGGHLPAPRRVWHPESSAQRCYQGWRAGARRGSCVHLSKQSPAGRCLVRESRGGQTEGNVTLHAVFSPDTPASAPAQAAKAPLAPTPQISADRGRGTADPSPCRVSCEGEGAKLPSRKRDLKRFRHDPWSGADLSPLLCLLPKRKKSCRVRRAFKELLNQRYMGASHLRWLLPELLPHRLRG